MATLICEGCGISFEYPNYPSRKPRRYCSLACQKIHNNKELTCERCGKTFIRRVFPSRKAPRYCSDYCRSIDSRKQEFVCGYCGKLFKVVMFPSIHRIPKYCSYECSKKDNAKPLINCKICGRPFRSNIHRGKYAELCSVDCRAKSQFKYSESLRNEMLELFQVIGAKRTSIQLKVPEQQVRLVARKAGIKPNPILRYSHFRDNPSQLEIDLYTILDGLNVDYFKQYPIGHFVVDAFIEPNIIIEADGIYWHGHPKFEPLTDRQLEQQKRDAIRDNYFSNRDYCVIRIWEHEMSKDRVEFELKAIGFL